MTKIIEKHGSLFRLSDAAYRRLLTSMIAGTNYDLWDLGRCIGCIHASLGSFDRDDAEFALARLECGLLCLLPTAAPNSSNRRR